MAKTILSRVFQPGANLIAGPIMDRHYSSSNPVCLSTPASVPNHVTWTFETGEESLLQGLITKPIPQGKVIILGNTHKIFRILFFN